MVLNNNYLNNLYQKKGICRRCPSNCSTCSTDGTVCTQCNASYFLLASASNGVFDSCVTCSDSNHYKFTTITNGSGVCRFCKDAITNCNVCNGVPTTCATCDTNYYKDVATGLCSLCNTDTSYKSGASDGSGK